MKSKEQGLHLTQPQAHVTRFVPTKRMLKDKVRDGVCRGWAVSPRRYEGCRVLGQVRRVIEII